MTRDMPKQDIRQIIVKVMPKLETIALSPRINMPNRITMIGPDTVLLVMVSTEQIFFIYYLH